MKNYFSRFDWIRPARALILRQMNPPSKVFFVPNGYSMGEIKAALGSKGTKLFGVYFTTEEARFSVTEQQAGLAEMGLREAGIPYDREE